MNPEVGDVLVYPVHGPMMVVARGSHPIREMGEAVTLTGSSSLRVTLPVDRLEKVGVRPLTPADEIDEVWEKLSRPVARGGKPWVQWMKGLRDQSQGDIYQVAGCVAALVRKEHDKRTLTPAEYELLKDTFPVLARELAAVEGLDDDEVVRMVVEVVTTGEVPVRCR